MRHGAGEVRGPIFLKRLSVGWGQRAKPRAFEGTLDGGEFHTGREDSAPGVAQVTAMVTIKGMGGKVPAPTENPAGLGAGGQQALTIAFRR